MGLIVNPRGTRGAGKTELVRQIMALYGSPGGGHMEPVYRAGRQRPICCRLRHPQGGRPLAVLGHYEVTSGGCDTIGDMDEVFGLAAGYAARGHDVLFEGLLVSREYQRSAALAEAHEVHILRLSTPLEQCIRQVVARRRARRDARPLISRSAAAEHAAVEEACNGLRWCASVQALEFHQALARAQDLLGIGQLPATGLRLERVTSPPTLSISPAVVSQLASRRA